MKNDVTMNKEQKNYELLQTFLSESQRDLEKMLLIADKLRIEAENILAKAMNSSELGWCMIDKVVSLRMLIFMRLYDTTDLILSYKSGHLHMRYNHGE